MGAPQQCDSPIGSGKGSPRYLNLDLVFDTELPIWRSGEATLKGESVSQGKDSHIGWAQQRAVRHRKGPSVALGMRIR